MILNIAQLREGVPEKVQAKLNAKDLDVEYVDLHYKNGIHVKGSAEKILNTVMFRGSISRKIEHICARCLKSVEENAEESVDFAYDVKGLEQVDMLDDIRDVLLLAHPDRFLCDVNCKGLCPKCGADLNRAQCHCESGSTSHPFSDLKKWFKKSS